VGKRWYQCTLHTVSGKLLNGIRGIALSEDAFHERVKSIVDDIIADKGLADEVIVTHVSVELVPDRVLKKYDLNNSRDHDRFIAYLDDDISTLN